MTVISVLRFLQPESFNRFQELMLTLQPTRSMPVLLVNQPLELHARLQRPITQFPLRLLRLPVLLLTLGISERQVRKDCTPLRRSTANFSRLLLVVLINYSQPSLLETSPTKAITPSTDCFTQPLWVLRQVLI